MPYNVVVSISRNLDSQCVFDECVLKRLRELNQSLFVSLATTLRQTSLSAEFSRPYKFMLLFPPVSPSSFTAMLHKGHQSCATLLWGCSDSGGESF